MLVAALNFKGLTHSLNDYSLFTSKSYSSFSIFIVTVDDIILIGNDVVELNSLKQFRHEEFSIKN